MNAAPAVTEPSPISAGESTVLERAAWILLCLFIFTIPWEKGVWVPGVGTIARTLGIFAFVGGVAVLLRRRAGRMPNVILLLAGVFVAWCATTYLWSVDQAATVARSITLAQLLAMMWLIWELCRSKERQRQLMGAYVLGAVAGCAITFVRYIQDIQTYYRRYASAGFDPNDFGMILALSIPFSLYLAIRAGRWTRWCWYAAAMMAISTVLLTASRTSLIATFIALSFAVWTWKKVGVLQRTASVCMMGYLVLSLVQFAPGPSRDRLATIPAEVSKGSFNSRKQIWKSGARVWIQHPVFGIGAGAYPEAVRPELGTPEIKGFQYVAHNTFLSVLVECGLVGFALWSTLLGLLLFMIWVMPGPERALWAVMLAAWTAGVTTLTWEHYKTTWLLFSLITTAWAGSWWNDGGDE